jgi:signal transduction histidine kinase/CheY-like chemotaxis protein/HPt (histidine-containing phosphotransfer) domain-containing protein
MSLPNQIERERSLFDAVSFWTGTSSLLALILVFGVGHVNVSVAIAWVCAHAVSAMFAAYCAMTSKRAVRPNWFAARPAQLTLLISVLLWALGVVFLTDGQTTEAQLPVLLVATGLACASVWLLSGDLLLMSATQVLLFLPMGFRLLTSAQPQFVATLLVLLLVVVNLLISRRWNNALDASATTAGFAGFSAQPNASAMQLGAQEAQFQAERLTQELKSELERHKNIEEELKAAKHAADAASMAKGEFLATMSHEIRTPLNGIIPLLEILRDSKLQPDQRDYLNTAYGSAKQLLSIIDDILDYSKIEANKLELEQTGLNMREVIDSVMRLMERPAQAKNLKLQLKLDPGVRLAMRGDPTRLRQVLTNLVSNAVKFTDKGGIQVEVTKRSETRTHQELVFAIKDSGIGISVEGQAKLFKAFQQADTSTTRTFGGTGLGLVICQRIVTLMNGQIGVKSETGKGSVFWFSVPMLKAAGDIGSARRDLNGVRALLISSDQRVTQRFTSVLSAQGMTLTHTNTTADGLSKLKSSATLGENWSYEIAVIDVNSMRTTAAGFIRNALREPSMERVKFLLVQSGEPLSADILDPRRCGSVMLNTSEGEVAIQLNRMLEVSQSTEQRFSLMEEAARMAADSFDAPSTPSGQVAGPVTGHVLLVEDNPVNRTVAMRVVSLIGLSVESAEHGKEALDKLSYGKFDLVLMDCQMPVMDGYTATRTRRTLEEERKLPHIPIIAMTANAMVGDREKCLASGMDDYLTKPLNRGLLEQTLRKWMPANAKTRVEHTPEDLRANVASDDVDSFAPARMADAFQTPARAPAPLSMEDELLADLARAAHAMPGFANELDAPAPREAPVAAVPRPVAAPAPQPAPKPAPAKPQKPAIDRSIFDELLEVMGSEFAALVKVYLEDTPKNLKILAQSAQRGQPEGMIAPAHSLKSTSANLGALGLSDIAKKIEHGARSNILLDPIAEAKAAIAEFERAAHELKALLKL